MNRDGTFWDRLIRITFILFIGVALGMTYRIKQVEPQLTTAQAEIKRTNRLMAYDLADLEVRIILLEKKIYGGRVKK